MRSGFRHELCVLLLLFLAAGPLAGTAAAETQPDPFRQALTKLAQTKGFSCKFLQEVYFAEGGQKSYTGTLAVKRPGLFRWQYVTPYEQLYVSDGTVIWHYEADLMQAERLQTLDAVDPAAMKLLDGRLGSRDIRLLSSKKGALGEDAYRVRIKGGPELTLAFRNNGSLYWIESEDMLGNRNRMILIDIDRTIPEEKLFHFVPPEGVEIVDLAGGGTVIPLQQTNTDGE